MKTTSEALRAWNLSGPIRPADDGLINQTFIVGAPPEGVLQWVNPIFDTAIQSDIQTLTERLHEQGMVTTRLIPTRDDRLWLEDGEAFWRLLTYIPGTTFHRLRSSGQARAAGELLGRFHHSLMGWQPDFKAPPRYIHHTPGHMDGLRQALETCDGHSLEAQTRELGRSILDTWEQWQGSLELPERICHGDPKISNLRFDARGEIGICLIDLDTIGPQTLASEMGDAWRSWCNPAGEDQPDACEFSLDLFRESAKGWLDTVGPLDPEELRSLVPGIERICLELAARFCADAVNNVYFREDRDSFPELGSHNLTRARCQRSLALSARSQSSSCERILIRKTP